MLSEGQNGPERALGEQVRPIESLESLMQGYQQADRDATSMLISRLSPAILQFFLGEVRDRSRAEDLLQDFWLRVHKARHTFQEGKPLLPWAYAIARRVRVDQYRRTRRLLEHELQSDKLPDMASEVPTPIGQNKLADLLKDLPKAQRETVLLLKCGGLSLQEVARTTGVSVGAVKQRAFRAYEALRKALGSAA